MTPETFKLFNSRVTKVIIPPLKEELERLKNDVLLLESSLKQHQRFQTCCQYLINGETMAGFFGTCPTYAFFVRQYRTEPGKVAGRPELVEVNLVIIPGLLEEHVLRVNVPSTINPGGVTNTPDKVDVSGIVKRMQEHTHNAKNVSVGTFADVLYEECTECGGQALVVAIDKYVDDDNGRDFTINRLCGDCLRVDRTAYYSGDYKKEDPQYCLTDGIYR